MLGCKAYWHVLMLGYRTCYIQCEAYLGVGYTGV